MQPVKYIGQKPAVRDTLCGTGLIWQNGETKPVSDEAAAKLLNYPELWVSGDATKSLSAMNKSDLAEYAMTTFGIELDTKATKDNMLADLEAKMPHDSDLKKDDPEEGDNDYGLSIPPTNMGEMSRNDLAAYAMREFGVQFDDQDSTEKMIDVISGKLGARKFE